MTALRTYVPMRLSEAPKPPYLSFPRLHLPAISFTNATPTRKAHSQFDSESLPSPIPLFTIFNYQPEKSRAILQSTHDLKQIHTTAVEPLPKMVVPVGICVHPSRIITSPVREYPSQLLSRICTVFKSVLRVCRTLVLQSMCFASNHSIAKCNEDATNTCNYNLCWRVMSIWEPTSCLWSPAISPTRQVIRTVSLIRPPASEEINHMEVPSCGIIRWRTMEVPAKRVERYASNTGIIPREYGITRQLAWDGPQIDICALRPAQPNAPLIELFPMRPPTWWDLEKEKKLIWKKKCFRPSWRLGPAVS